MLSRIICWASTLNYTSRIQRIQECNPERTLTPSQKDRKQTQWDCVYTDQRLHFREDCLLLLLLFFFFLLFVIFFLFLCCRCVITTFLLAFWSFRCTSLLAWSLSEPFWQFLCRSLGKFFIFLFPDGIKRFGSENLPATFIQLFSVSVGSSVCSPFILGVHADHWGVFANEGLWVKTLLQGLLSELSLLPLLQFLEVKLLCQLPLLIIIFVSLQCNNNIEKFIRLSFELIRVQSFKFKRLYSDAQGNFFFLFQLFFGLGHFFAGIIGRASSSRFLLSTFGCLLSFKHLLTLGLSFFKALFLFFSFLGLLFSFLLSEFLFLFLLLLVEFLLLFSSDLLPFGLLLLQLFKLLLFLFPGLSPFCDVLLQLAVKSLLLLCFFCSVSHCVLLCKSLRDDTALDVLNRVPC